MASAVKAKPVELPPYQQEFQKADNAVRNDYPFYETTCQTIEDQKTGFENKLADWAARKSVDWKHCESEIQGGVTSYRKITGATTRCFQLIEKLVAALKTHQDLNKPIPTETLNTLKALVHIKPDDVQKEQETIQSNIRTLESHRAKTQSIYAQMVARLPKFAQELDACIKFVRTQGTAEWRIWGYLKNQIGATPYLDAELAEKEKEAKTKALVKAELKQTKGAAQS